MVSLALPALTVLTATIERLGQSCASAAGARAMRTPHSMRPSRSPSPEHDAPDRAAPATGGARPALARRTRANSRAETGFGYFERLLMGSGAIILWESNVRRSRRPGAHNARQWGCLSVRTAAPL